MKIEETNLIWDEELAQVSGGDGDIEITFEYIMQFIEEGNERMAAHHFNLAQYYLKPKDAYDIRMAFWAKFGYPIDMYDGRGWTRLIQTKKR